MRAVHSAGHRRPALSGALVFRRLAFTWHRMIGTALRPHPGFGQSLAHIEFNTTVLTHTLSFHEPFAADEWFLLDQEAPYAGRGRSYGRAHVWTSDGRLVASFVQDAMIRAFPPTPPKPPG